MRRSRHNGAYGDVLFVQAANELKRLIGRNAAADDKKDAFSRISAHADSLLHAVRREISPGHAIAIDFRERTVRLSRASCFSFSAKGKICNFQDVNSAILNCVESGIPTRLET
jgi:hypothetical protein